MLTVAKYWSGQKSKNFKEHSNLKKNRGVKRGPVQKYLILVAIQTTIRNYGNASNDSLFSSCEEPRIKGDNPRYSNEYNGIVVIQVLVHNKVFNLFKCEHTQKRVY